LSQAAFNAFLKTLEEPPSYAKFILATTEKHKILPTILSRCQVYDFRRISIKYAIEQLIDICNKEGISYEETALHIIAQKADGAMRDALSIFDRVISFTGKSINYQDVIQQLNVLDYDYYFKLCDYFLASDLAEVMLLFNEILDKGFDAGHFLTGISEHIRNLMMCKNANTTQLLEMSEGTQVLYIDQAKKFNLDWIISGLNIINQFDVNFKTARNQRLHVEMALMKLCYLHQALTVEELIEKKN